MSSETGITALVAHAIAGFPAVLPANRVALAGAPLEGEVLAGEPGGRRPAGARRGVTLEQAFAGSRSRSGSGTASGTSAVPRPRTGTLHPGARQAAAFYLANAVTDPPPDGIDLFV